MRFGGRELLFFVLLLGLPTAAYFLPWDKPVPGLRRLNEQIEDARQEIVTKRSKLQQLEAATQNLESLTAEITKLSDAVEMFERRLPAQQEVEVILEDVWNLADKHDLTPKSVRTDKITTTAQYAELPIKMEINGNFDGFYEFLLDLEQLPRITRVPAMTLNKSRDKEGNMEAEIILSVFFEGENPAKLKGQLQERRS